MKKILAAVLLMPCMAYAEFLTGNQLLQRIRSDEVVERMVALGYIMGVSDARQSVSHCAGAQVTAGQTRDVVRQYLERNPANRDWSADLLITFALAEVWPCKNQNNGKRS